MCILLYDKTDKNTKQHVSWWHVHTEAQQGSQISAGGCGCVCWGLKASGDTKTRQEKAQMVVQGHEWWPMAGEISTKCGDGGGWHARDTDGCRWSRLGMWGCKRVYCGEGTRKEDKNGHEWARMGRNRHTQDTRKSRQEQVHTQQSQRWTDRNLGNWGWWRWRPGKKKKPGTRAHDKEPEKTTASIRNTSKRTTAVTKKKKPTLQNRQRKKKKNAKPRQQTIAWPRHDLMRITGKKKQSVNDNTGQELQKWQGQKTPATTRQEKLYYKMGKKKAPTSAK